ncbi:MAG TPA: hypothetical protein VFS58_11080 [Steroidobacteraceae bacterium]|nr:hypothetical protein [Steroidobacteraceae bacterium]
MKKSTLLAGIGLALSMVMAGNVSAGTPRLDRREANQAGRIHNGVVNGELTRAETRRLAAGQVHLRRAEARAKSDGVVTARERAHLQHEANQQSRRIYRQKHDAQDRG